MRVLPSVLLGLLVGPVYGCDRAPNAAPKPEAKELSSPRGKIALGPPPPRAVPQIGMAYVPPGALVVGTPPALRPRRPDREAPGEQLMLAGFYIDQYPYPNEEGAIPRTNVTQHEAEALCAERGKRLCSELEWERACKGPDNHTFEYGDTYVAESCHLAREASLRPSGYYPSCQSDFGVRDLHGGPYEWTRSSYGRGTTGVSLKGGSGTPGKVFGRCANVEHAEPNQSSGQYGFRCCLGEAEETTLPFEVRSHAGLQAKARFEPAIEKELIAALPAEVSGVLLKAGKLRAERAWLWHPVTNEDIHLLAVCGRHLSPRPSPECGLLAARRVVGQVEVLAWISSGEWVAIARGEGPTWLLSVHGGDRRGAFSRTLEYRYGEVTVGPVVWGGATIQKPTKTKRPRGKRP